MYLHKKKWKRRKLTIAILCWAFWGFVDIIKLRRFTHKQTPFNVFSSSFEFFFGLASYFDCESCDPESLEHSFKQRSIPLSLIVAFALAWLRYRDFAGEIKCKLVFDNDGTSSVLQFAGSSKFILPAIPNPLFSAPFLPFSCWIFLFSEDDIFFFGCDTMFEMHARVKWRSQEHVQ